MLQRAKYERGDCDNARSPAPLQCRHAASIVRRARAAKILFPEATRGPRPSSATQLIQAGHGRTYVVRATARLGAPLRRESCRDSTSIPEAARVELKHVLSRYKVPSPLLRWMCGGRHVPYHCAPNADAAAPTLRAALRLWYANAPQLSFCKVMQPKSYSQRRRAAHWCVAAAPPAQCVIASALGDRRSARLCRSLKLHESSCQDSACTSEGSTDRAQRDAAAVRYGHPTLTRAAAAGDVSAAAALAPLLRARAGAHVSRAAKHAGALLLGVVAPLLGTLDAVRLGELCLRLRRQPELLLSFVPPSCSRARRRR